MITDWLRGGPFLELSFIIKEERPLTDLFESIRQASTAVVEIHHEEEGMAEFNNGNLYDDADPNGLTIHQTCLKLTIHTVRTRRGLLFVERVHDRLLCLCIYVYGSEFDADEWKQPGIREDELPEFDRLLRELHTEFRFLIGGIAFEEDVKCFFDAEHPWPHPDYSIENITADRIASRKEALSRFAHGCEHVLIEDYMNEIEKPSSDSREILRLLKTYEASNEAYCLSFDPELDGRTVPLPDVLQAAEALYKLKLGRTSNELSKLGRQLYVRRDRHDLSRKRGASAAVG